MAAMKETLDRRETICIRRQAEKYEQCSLGIREQLAVACVGYKNRKT